MPLKVGWSLETYDSKPGQTNITHNQKTEIIEKMLFKN